jgi:hypothetical protein
MSHDRREWREEFRVAGEKVGETVRRLVREGNARRIIIRKPSGEIIKEINLTRGVAAGGLLAMVAPALAAIGAIVALLSEVRIEVVRVGPAPGESEADAGPSNERTSHGAEHEQGDERTGRADPRDPPDDATPL